MIKLNLMDEWLVENERARYNLGESGVSNMSMADVLETTPDALARIAAIDFDHNDTRGSRRLRGEIALLYDNRDVADILVTTGVSEALFLYFQHRFRPGANVVVVTPTFHSLYDAPEAIGYAVRRVPVRFEDKFRLPVEEIVACVDADTVAVVLNSPNNPTGAVVDPQGMKALLRRIPCEILVDEHYRLISLDQRHPVLPSLSSLSDRIISVGSFGKCLGAVGLRVGWMVAPGRLIEEIHALKLMTTHAISKLVDHLACEILSRRSSLVPPLRNRIAANVGYFTEAVKRLPDALDWVPPVAGTVGLPRLTAAPSDSMAFAQRLLGDYDVLVLPGESFEMPGFFRIRLGVDEQDFRYATDAIVQILTRR